MCGGDECVHARTHTHTHNMRAHTHTHTHTHTHFEKPADSHNKFMLLNEIWWHGTCVQNAALMFGTGSYSCSLGLLCCNAKGSTFNMMRGVRVTKCQFYLEGGGKCIFKPKILLSLHIRVCRCPSPLPIFMHPPSKWHIWDLKRKEKVILKILIFMINKYCWLRILELTSLWTARGLDMRVHAFIEKGGGEMDSEQ